MNDRRTRNRSSGTLAAGAACRNPLAACACASGGTHNGRTTAAQHNGRTDDARHKERRAQRRRGRRRSRGGRPCRTVPALSIHRQGSSRQRLDGCSFVRTQYGGGTQLRIGWVAAEPPILTRVCKTDIRPARKKSPAFAGAPRSGRKNQCELTSRQSRPSRSTDEGRGIRSSKTSRCPALDDRDVDVLPQTGTHNHRHRTSTSTIPRSQRLLWVPHRSNVVD